MTRKTKLQKEYFDVYYDIGESLHEMVQEEMDHIYKKKPRSKHNLDKMNKREDCRSSRCDKKCRSKRNTK